MLKLIRIPKATLAAKNAFAAKYLDFCLSILNESNDLNDLSSLSEYGFILEYREKLWEVVDCLTVFREVSEVSYFRRAEIIISRIAHVNE